MKRLIIIRHAHRDVTDRMQDNGLSPKGRIQAKALVDLYSERIGRDGLGATSSVVEPLILSSPRKRCQETLESLSKALKISVKVDPRLDEQHAAETIREWTQRVQAFIAEWKSSPEPLWVVCSHGDWIPFALEILIHQSIDVKKGAWIELELKGDQVTLTQCIQRPSKEI